MWFSVLQKQRTTHLSCAVNHSSTGEDTTENLYLYCRSLYCVALRFVWNLLTGCTDPVSSYGFWTLHRFLLPYSKLDIRTPKPDPTVEMAKLHCSLCNLCCVFCDVHWEISLSYLLYCSLHAQITKSGESVAPLTPHNLESEHVD